MKPRTLSWLLRRSLISTLKDGCIGYAKGAAYSALLAFFPLLTTAAAVMVQTRTEFVARNLERFLSQIVPPGTEDLVVRQFRVMGARPIGLLVIAVLISLWAASGVIKSLIEGFQAAYRVPRNRGVVRQSGVAMSLVLLSAVPLVFASLLLLFGGQVERVVLRWLSVDPLLNPLSAPWQFGSRLARYGLAAATTVAVTSSLYYFGPNRRQRWKNVWRGAILATVLWFFATLGFAWYVRNMATYNVMYGSIGAGIALLVWMFLIALIALIGCEFNAEYERERRKECFVYNQCLVKCVVLVAAVTLSVCSWASGTPVTLVSESEAEPIHSAVVRKEAWTLEPVRKLRTDAKRHLKEGPWSVTFDGRKRGSPWTLTTTTAKRRTGGRSRRSEGTLHSQGRPDQSQPLHGE